MTHFLLKLSLPFMIVFTLILLLVHAQPSDDADLHAFLMPPEGCPAPCFMGIRPGFTSAEEAVRLLKMHTWVSQVRQPYASILTWTWSGAQPALVDASRPGRLMLTPDFQKVSQILITTSVDFGRFWLDGGAPPDYWVSPMSSDGGYTVGTWYNIGYQDRGLVLRSRILCGMPIPHLWESGTDVQIGNTVGLLPLTTPSTFLGQITSLQRINCARYHS
jgi:hypothetical protein